MVDLSNGNIPCFPYDEGLKYVLNWSPYIQEAARQKYQREFDKLTKEKRTTSRTGGQKGVKLARFDLIPAFPLWQLAELYGRGAEKYEPRNWELGYEWSKSFGSLMRHAWLFWNGEDIDEETGMPHMSCVAFHAFALEQFRKDHPDFDDRPRSD